MKKFTALLAGLVACSAVYALPIGNPGSPEFLKAGLFTCEEDAWGIELGYRGDFVHDRQLRLRDPILGVNTRIDQFNFHVNAGQLTVNLWDRLDVYGWVGEGRAEVNTEIGLVFPGGVVDVARLGALTNHNTVWGVGAKAVLWECDRWTLALGGQYQRFTSRFREITILNDFEDAVLPVILVDDPGAFRLRTREWQVDLALGYRICMLSPYVAVKYSNSRHRITGSDTTDLTPFDADVRLRNRHYWGGAVGLTLIDADRMQVTAEYRFADECALSILADFRF